MHRYLFVLFFLFLIPSQVFAYLDPGSGTVLLYALIGLGLTFLYTLRGFFYKIRNSLGGKKISKDWQESDVILHSEGKQYELLFLPLIEELSKREIKTSYITQYKRSTGHRTLPHNIEHKVIDAGPLGFATLNRVKAKVFVTTTPQLDVMMFKRSKGVQHYSYLFHAPTDIAPYKPFAFDFFDSILCPGPPMMESIRRIEEIRHLPQKKLYETGVLYYDELLEKRKTKPSNQEKEKKNVLIAPSWGKNGLFTRLGCHFLDDLSKEFALIVRPHPQMKISQKELFDELCQKCTALNIPLDQGLDAQESMESSDLMLSDFSGVIYDYCYLYEKPVMLLDTLFDWEAFEGRLLPKPLWQNQMREKIAAILPIKQWEKSTAMIKEVLKKNPQNWTNLRSTNLFNFGKAAPVAGRQIEEILNKIPAN